MNERPTPETDALCAKLFHDGGPSPVDGWTCPEESAWKLAAIARRLERQRDELAEHLNNLFQMMEDGYLVRNTVHDGADGWAMRQLPYVQKLHTARAALAKVKGGK